MESTWHSSVAKIAVLQGTKWSGRFFGSSSEGWLWGDLTWIHRPYWVQPTRECLGFPGKVWNIKLLDFMVVINSFVTWASLLLQLMTVGYSLLPIFCAEKVTSPETSPKSGAFKNIPTGCCPWCLSGADFSLCWHPSSACVEFLVEVCWKMRSAARPTTTKATQSGGIIQATLSFSKISRHPFFWGRQVCIPVQDEHHHHQRCLALTGAF